MPLRSQDVFEWHAKPGAFERLSPPWVDMEVLERTGGVEDGAQVELLIKQGPAQISWRLAHKDFIVGRQFKDYQLSGPFAFWEQLHSCEPIDNSSSILRDSVEFELPFSMVSNIVAAPMVAYELRRLFRYRHRLMEKDCQSILQYGEKATKIAVTGSTGLVGRHIIPFFWTQNAQVIRFLRPQSDKSEIVKIPGGSEPVASWDPQAGEIDKAALNNLDALVHLSGENISSGRWTTEKKERLRESRMASTRLLVDAVLGLKNPPRVFVSASAIGYYGDRGKDYLDESSPVGKGFLAHLCEEWEATTAPLIKAGIRVVNLRIGVVLSPKGGALRAMLPAFQLGVGGPIGSGKQFFSWISPDDVAGAIYHCIQTESLSGPVNLVAPNAVTNREFANVLGNTISRPAIFPMPSVAVQMLFGQFADEGLLSSTRVLPKKLLESGYSFRDATLKEALASQLGNL